MLFALLSACGRPAPGYFLDAADVEVGVASLDLGEVGLGANAAGLVVVTNRGTTSATVTATVTAPFELSEASASVSVAGGAEASLEVRYRAADYAPASGVLAIASGDQTFEVTLSATTNPDSDADGVTAVEVGGDDCDDLDATVLPGAPDPCYDGTDQDCDASAGIDPEETDCDGDGALLGDDCDDEAPTVAPGAPEVEDGVDQDCDGLRDEDFRAVGDLFLAELAPGDGGWIEICNATAGDVPADAFSVAWDGGAAELPPITVPGGACVAACARASDDCAVEVSLTFPADSPVRILAGSLELDEVPVNAGWGLDDGTIYSLDAGAQSAVANDEAAAWCATIGSPGVRNPACGS